VGLPQHGWKKQRMLFYLAISEIAPLDDAVSELFHFILDQVVDGPARRTRDFESVGDQLLMKHMQMRRIDGVFHRLQPVAVELRHRPQPVPAVGARPDIVLWNRRRRLRSEVSPVKPRQLLDRISFVPHSPAKIALRRLRRGFKTITLNIIEPAMIRACNAAFFDSAVGKRGAAVRTAVLQKAQLALLALKQHQVFTENPNELNGVLLRKIVCEGAGRPLAAQ